VLPCSGGKKKKEKENEKEKERKRDSTWPHKYDDVMVISLMISFRIYDIIVITIWYGFTVIVLFYHGVLSFFSVAATPPLHAPEIISPTPCPPETISPYLISSKLS